MGGAEGWVLPFFKTQTCWRLSTTLHGVNIPVTVIFKLFFCLPAGSVHIVCPVSTDATDSGNCDCLCGNDTVISANCCLPVEVEIQTENLKE